ncbi:4Fe-4S binding protein [Ruminiclostridium cellulolyticum]|uniref:4Fe-4S ferredoxin iron-sulfur binding domain protein n=1 Tax=Ruminiclostridium cellulolyticum (strain ATCC 35319 / DSM 5812 / JCM 6584 / H10) TaxID=394503 RepID=B8I788_RUMCH|nr:4Fe-4S binding protein [Ruminiclostridium cellulolyticum]ACL75012.1 4Fe-4S ferredoxin iron-sulfur binding domain protein [Ruminiclostridium cellulolyticum H10]
MNTIKSFVHKWAWLLLIFFCIVGLVYPKAGIAAIICMLAPVAVSFFRGRMWCGNFCPRGSMNDILISKISRNKKIPRIMKNMWFRLIFLVVLMGAFTVQFSFAWGDMVQVGQVFVRMILITTGLTIVLGVIFSHRAWCVICPMGTMASLITKAGNSSRVKNVAFDKQRCVSCNLCTKSCPMEIDVLNFKSKGEVTHSDCLKCGECVVKCPKDVLEI